MNSDTIARDLLARGFQPVLLKPRSKVPPTDGWQHLRYTALDVPRVFGNSCNVGILLGEPSDNTVDLDVDHPKGAAALRAVGAPATLAYHHNGRPHLLFRCEPAPATTKYQGTRGGKLITFIEVRSTGAQSVAPGSIHPDTGKPYEWTNNLPRADWVPQDALNFGRELATVCLLADHWGRPEPNESGGRHQLALAVAGFLARRTDDDTVLRILGGVATVMDDEERSDRLQAGHDTLRKVSRGLAVVGLPTLAALIGEDDARTLGKWWPEPPGLSLVLSPNGAVAHDVFALDDDDEAPAWVIYDAADFLAIPFPAVEWRIASFLREKAILFDFGAPGSIKTYLATDAAIATATGGLFLGQFACTQGKVLIVQEDTLDSDFQHAYLAPMVAARGLTADDLRGWLYVAPPGGFSLDSPDRLAQLRAWCAENRPSLIVFDAFYLLHGGEGYGNELKPTLQRLKRLRRDFACAIWVIDHDRKGGQDNPDENPVDRLYGGRQKSAAVDVLLESRPVKGEHGVTFLHTLKLRGAKPHDPVQVTLNNGALTITGAGASAEDTLEGATKTVYEWLRRGGCNRTTAEIIKGTRLAERSVRGAIGELKRLGQIDVGHRGAHGALYWSALLCSEAAAEPELELEITPPAAPEGDVPW